MSHAHSIHTTGKTFRNFIKSNRNKIVYTILRLISNQTDVRLVPNQSTNGKYNLISVWFNKISKKNLCVQQDLSPIKNWVALSSQWIMRWFLCDHRITAAATDMICMAIMNTNSMCRRIQFQFNKNHVCIRVGFYQIDLISILYRDCSTYILNSVNNYQ